MVDQPEGAKTDRSSVAAVRFKQWLSLWDEYDFDENAHRRRPPEHLFMFSMRAAELRKLCDVYRRQRQGIDAEGIQRYRDPSRTGRIRRYVRYGYPFGDLNTAQEDVEENQILRKPGWLPTAIVVNILTLTDIRRGRSVKPEHLIYLNEKSASVYEIDFPLLENQSDVDLAPLEVIDGQHRLWAFDKEEMSGSIPEDFELPVVAFLGLDIAWQAYLFWSINVSPKRINPSHAFDLYPLLRTQDWLERAGELRVYREARAQELTELIYRHELSPWRLRINMLGERGAGSVSQASWVRAFTSSLLSVGRGRGRRGLFEAPLEGRGEPLDWSRSQQAAFVIQVWRDLKAAMTESKNLLWIRVYELEPEKVFESRTCMLNQDQGVRAVLATMNDVFYEKAVRWGLDRWYLQIDVENDLSDTDVAFALDSLVNVPFRTQMLNFARDLISFDWRSYDAPKVKTNEDAELRKRAYRGSGGYAALRLDVLEKLSTENDEIGQAALNLIASVR